MLPLCDLHVHVFPVVFIFFPVVTFFLICSSLHNLEPNYTCSKYFLALYDLSCFIIHGVLSAQILTFNIIKSIFTSLLLLSVSHIFLKISRYMNSCFQIFCRIYQVSPPHLAFWFSRNFFYNVRHGCNFLFILRITRTIHLKCHLWGGPSGSVG